MLSFVDSTIPLLFELNSTTRAKMCGIAVMVFANVPRLPQWPCWEGLPRQGSPKVESPKSATPSPTLTDLLPVLQKRGPDYTELFSIRTSTANSALNDSADLITINAAYSVLSIRGPVPKRRASGSAKVSGNGQVSEVKSPPTVLLFNGEIYDGFDDTDESISDTDRVHELLNRTLAEREDPLQTLDALRGPWALIFWHEPTKRLYFGRDCLGRRSLMINVEAGSHVTITSVPPPHSEQHFVELPPHGLAYLDFSGPLVTFNLYPRPVNRVPPVRMEGLPATTVACGSTAEMYISYLPSHYLRRKLSATNTSRPLDHPVEGVIEQFISIMRQSVFRRLATRLRPEKDHERFALLFSGGVDSMVLARLLDMELPKGEPLQLINVAFGDGKSVSECPDRKSAQAGLYELRNLSKRPLSLIKVDVPAAQADATLQTVQSLLRPCNAPMDATIGTALWLAARGIGIDADDNEPTTSAARILFSGLGADELLGGYKGRHRTTFRTGGEDALARELDGDLSRLWFRNLGRDDRIISSVGKEIRHPFLDEDFIQFISKLPLSSVCNLTLPDGEGDKQILRKAAIFLGLSVETSKRAKRAIQFGSRGKHVLERKK